VRCRSQRHDDPRRHRGDLGFEPWKAGFDFHSARLAVNLPRPARHPFEMLDDVRDVSLRSIDSNLREAAIEQLARGSD
jgi:hypothetical protein